MIELDSIDGLQGVFDGVAEDFDAIDYTGPLTDELGLIEQKHAEYFARATGPDGQAWAPLAPSTIQRKGHDTILVDKRDLRGSLTGAHPDAIRDVFDEGSNAGLTFGTRREYSGYHDKPAANRPARRHVGIDEQHLSGVAGRIADYTLEDLAQ